MNELPIILIVGPTGSGKTDLSIKVAKTFNGECINADSTQIFSGTDIATNKITEKEMQGVKHHLLSAIPVTGTYSVADFQKQGRDIISKLLSNNLVPVIVGGTGLYINGLIKKYNFPEEQKSELYNPELDKYNNQQLWNMINEFDPIEAKKIHVNNRQRLLRANSLIFNKEFLKSEIIQNGHEPFFPNKLIIIGLNPNRANLHEALNNRVNRLISKGLFEEIQKAYEDNNYNDAAQALKCIGGKEIVKYLKGEISYEQAILDMQTANRRYARKQITWFKHQLENVQWFEYDLIDFDKTCQAIIKYIHNTF